MPIIQYVFIVADNGFLTVLITITCFVIAIGLDFCLR